MLASETYHVFLILVEVRHDFVIQQNGIQIAKKSSSGKIKGNLSLKSSFCPVFDFQDHLNACEKVKLSIKDEVNLICIGENKELGLF